jgi:uncharacterized protein (TIGR02271 family)
MPHYRQNWESRYGKSGGRWDEYEPGYRYAWEMRQEPRFSGRSWTEAEPDLRRDWETRHKDRPWDRFGSAVRDVWEDATDKVEVHEEQLRARKETVNAGEVAVRKEVVTERREMDVPVRREEVVVERHAVPNRPASSADFGSSREEIRVPLREEQVTLEKQAVVTEEIEIGKRTVQDTEHVGGTVRKEVAHVEKTGDVTVRGDATDSTRDPRAPRRNP